MGAPSGTEAERAALPLDARIASALAVPTRAGLLRLLRLADAPRTAAELAQDVGLHVNTARAHLELLVEVHLATRTAEAPRGPGRPRVVYAAAPNAPAIPPPPAPQKPADPLDSYRELAALLVDELAASGDAERVALSAGRRWTSVIDGLGWPDRPHTRDEASARLVDLLDRLGFGPSTEPLGDRIYLHACPFAELARRSPTVVCGVHLGLLRGAVDRLRSPLTVAGVDPFIRDTLCVVQVATTATG